MAALVVPTLRCVSLDVNRRFIPGFYEGFRGGGLILRGTGFPITTSRHTSSVRPKDDAHDGAGPAVGATAVASKSCTPLPLPIVADPVTKFGTQTCDRLCRGTGTVHSRTRSAMAARWSVRAADCVTGLTGYWSSISARGSRFRGRWLDSFTSGLGI